MKIFLVCDVLLDGGSAQTNHILELFKNLSDSNEAYLFAPKIKKRLNKNLDIIYVKSVLPLFKPVFYPLSLFFYLSYYCLKQPPDVIYNRHSNLTIPTLIISIIFRISYLVEINGVLIEEMQINNRSKIVILITKLIENINYKFTDKIVAVTQTIKNEIKRIYKVADDRIVVIQNGVNTDLFRLISKDKLKFSLDENYNYVGFSGSFSVWHGLKELVRSAPLILEENPTTKFLLVGDGPMKGDIVRMINDLDLTRHFIFINRVPYEEVPEYVNTFDVCVILKNKKIPGSPLKLWEYLACGKPVIATASQDFEVLEEYNAGVLVDPEKPEEVAAAIIKLLKDEKLRDEMGKNGRKYVVENRSWDTVAREVEKVMNEAIKAGRRYDRKIL